MNPDRVDLTDFDRLVLSRYPFPIAVNYRRVLEAQSWRERVEHAIMLFKFQLRSMALVVISQYVIHDAEDFFDRDFNEQLLSYLPRAQLGHWKRMLFLGMAAYAGRRDQFFMKELYDLFYVTSGQQHRKRKGLNEPYDHLISLRNDLAHDRQKPRDEHDYEKLAGEVMPDLRQILGQLAFIQHYELVRIVERRLEGMQSQYCCQAYTGELPNLDPHTFVSSQELQVGWSYLSRGKNVFLQLHPLLVFWEDMPSRPSGDSVNCDAILYETYTKRSAMYLAATPQQVIEYETLASEIARIVYYTLENLKQSKSLPGQLTWAQLHDTAPHIARSHFGEVQAKYQPELYLQRQDVRQAFVDFLASDKIAFLLLGKSGVGKSNFFVSMVEELQDAERDACVLAYNGANLEADTALSSTIGRDLNLPEGDDFLEHLSRIEGIQSRQVILIVDAVNENADARQLLRRIDQLVASCRYPWFKVAFSSRPEAWRAMKRHVHLREHLYYHGASETPMGVELQPFSHDESEPSEPGTDKPVQQQRSPGVEVKRFSKQELPEVYENYRQVYDLQTRYENIPSELRRLLDDPLTLKLVAETYAGTTLPASFRPGEMYEQYVNRMVTSERLDWVDVNGLLEQELMPLMLSQDHYANVVTAEQVARTTTTSGQRLAELIHEDGELSGGRKINQSFVNLVDAEILMMQGSPTDYQIGFKYERFYDYFAGKRLQQLGNDLEDRQAYFLELIQETIQRPFLWGAVKAALLMEAKRENGLAMVLPVCYTDQQRVKEMLVAMLTDLGQDQPVIVRDSLAQMLSDEEEPAGIGRAHPKLAALFHGRPSRPMSKETLTACEICVEVSAALHFTELLEQAASHYSPAVRAATAQQIYYIWRQDRVSGYRVLEGLSQNVRRHFGLPDIGRLDICFIISSLILYERYRDQDVRDSLQRIWRYILESLLPPIIVKKKTMLNSLAKKAAIGAVARIIRRLLPSPSRIEPFDIDAGAFNRPEFEYWFRCRDARRETVRRLIRFVDPDYGRVDDLEDMLVRGLPQYNDIVTWWLATIILTARLVARQDETLPVTRKLFEALSGPEPMAANVMAIGWSTFVASFRDDPSGHVFGLYSDAVWHFWQTARGRFATDIRTYTGSTGISGHYVEFCRQRHADLVPPRLEEEIQRAVAEKDIVFAKNTLFELTYLARDGYADSALQIVEALLDFPDGGVQDLVLGTLATIRAYEQELVDDFLDAHQFPPRTRDRVRTLTPAESLSGMWVVGGASFGLNAVIDYPYMQQLVQWVFRMAVDSRNLNQFLERLIARAINLVYGEPVFDVPD